MKTKKIYNNPEITLLDNGEVTVDHKITQSCSICIEQGELQTGKWNVFFLKMENIATLYFKELRDTEDDFTETFRKVYIYKNKKWKEYKEKD